MKSFFTKHPEEIGETYGEHLKTASLCGLKLVFAGIACILHSIFPFIFVDTASKTVVAIHDKMRARQIEREKMK